MRTTHRSLARAWLVLVGIVACSDDTPPAPTPEPAAIPTSFAHPAPPLERPADPATTQPSRIEAPLVRAPRPFTR